MTNLEKFIEMMNKTFNARMKPENMELRCSPCGTLKKYNHACKIFSCEKCKAWWHKEYHPSTEQCKPEHAHSLDGESKHVKENEICPRNG